MRCCIISLAALFAGACATPVTQTGTVSSASVLQEEAVQKRFTLRTLLVEQRRLDRVSYPLLRAAVPICGADVQPRVGVFLGNATGYAADWIEAARGNGLTDTLELIDVAPGSAAERAGLKAGDRILKINDRPIPIGSGARDVAMSVMNSASEDRDPVRFTIRRPADERVSVLVPFEQVCSYSVVVEQASGSNASADGHTVRVTRPMLRLADDDNELSIVVGHEIAHNAMHHIDAAKQNAGVGAVLGALVDVLAASRGIRTGGENMRQGAMAGMLAYSQDFEREADYVGLYIVSLANLPIDSAATVWRKIAVENPQSITFASTHPTTAERFVRLESWRGEIQRKIASGSPILPDLKNGNWSAQALASAQAARNQDRGKGTTQVATQSPASRDASNSLTSPSKPAAIRNDTPQRPAPKAQTPAPPTPATSPRVLPGSDDRMATAVVGAPSSDSARVAAEEVYDEGRIYSDRHEWGKALILLRRSLLLDGSIAERHAAVGSVEMNLGHWAEAEAEYTAASLIDVANQDYRKQMLEARRRRSMK